MFPLSGYCVSRLVSSLNEDTSPTSKRLLKKLTMAKKVLMGDVGVINIAEDNINLNEECFVIS